MEQGTFCLFKTSLELNVHNQRTYGMAVKIYSTATSYY